MAFRVYLNSYGLFHPGEFVRLVELLANSDGTDEPGPSALRPASVC